MTQVCPPGHPPLRVVFVIQQLAGLRGGAERVFVETAEAMQQRGMQVQILSFDPGAASSSYGGQRLVMQSLFPLQTGGGGRQLPGMAQIKRLLKATPNIFPLTYLKWRLSHGLFAARLRQYLNTHPTDIVVAFLPPAITAAAWALRGLDVALIASTHNLPEMDFGNSPRWDQNPLYRRRARQALTTAACVTVLQPEFAGWFPAGVQRHIQIMPNPVERLAPQPEAQPRAQIILGVGRLTRIKRWDLLISAFARVAPALPDWQLQLFGAGPEQPALAQQILDLGLTEQVHLMGTTGAIAAVYDQAAILAHPAEFEGFGLSVAEAMAHGLPVVAFADCPGVNRLITSQQDGLLLPRGSDSSAAESLAEALLHLAKDEGLRRALGQEAARITTRYDRHSIHDQWADLLRRCAART